MKLITLNKQHHIVECKIFRSKFKDNYVYSNANAKLHLGPRLMFTNIGFNNH
jgi:hypothetical protein